MLIWQYGSNMDHDRLNAPDRLNGLAVFASLATAHGYTLTFPRTNRHGIGTASVARSHDDDYVIGVLYEIPNESLERMDEIEGVHSRSYRRAEHFELEALSMNRTSAVRESIAATTYIANEQPGEHRTNSPYANHILQGILNFHMGLEYFNRVRQIILRNNPSLEGQLIRSN